MVITAVGLSWYWGWEGEGVRDEGREGGRDGSREVREEGRQGGRQGGREWSREGGREEGRKKGRKEGRKEKGERKEGRERRREGGRDREIYVMAWQWLFLTWSSQPANITDDSMIVHCTLIPSASLLVLGRSPHKQRREKNKQIRSTWSF